jgi:salicylate hydroxylase
MMMRPSHQPVTIIGAGVSGLTLALLLRLRRYERRRRVRTRQVQLMSWAASAALHLPDGPASQHRNTALTRLADSLAWIHGYDVLADNGTAN